jgi:tetratricopeptide (TPR) repeat protein
MKLHWSIVLACVGLGMLPPLLRGVDPDNPLDLSKEQVEQFEAKTKAGDFGACLQLSDYFCLVKNDPKAAAHWWEVLVNLGDVEAIVEVGNCLMQAGEFDAAEKWILRAKENGDSVDNYLQELAKRRAAAGGGKKKNAGAAADIPPSPIDPSDPKDASGYIARAKIRIDKENFPAAIADVDRAIELDPKNATAYFERGEAKACEGNLDAAIADYTRAIELNPKYAMAYCRRGFFKGTKGDMEGLFADENRAVELDPNSATAYCFRAIARANRGDQEGAIADDTRAIELGPNYATAYSDRGGAKARKGDLEGAVADCTRAIELDPKYSKYYSERAFAESLARNWPAALADYRKFCDLPLSEFQQDYPRFSIWLIRARGGETEAASKELSAYLSKRDEQICGVWGSKVGAFLLGKTDEAAFLAAAESPDAKKQSEQHCEAWYYAGMKKLLAGDKTTAAEDFKKCVATGREDFVEYAFAKGELKAVQ